MKPVSFALALIVLCVAAGCQKITRDVSEAERPADAPEYSVEFDPNDSPA